jgi:tetratricopeptide (TPR) repeat protein
MKLSSLAAGLAIAATATFATVGISVAQDFDPAAVARDARTAIGESLVPDTRELVELAEENEPTAEGAEGLGHALLMSRHLAPSGYMFALAVERGPERAAALSDLGVVGLELSAAGAPVEALGPDSLVALQREALALDPGNQAIQYNLATALIAQGGEAALDEAIGLLEALHDAAPDDPRFAARLAAALKLAGRDDEAAAMLAEAYVADPTSPYVSAVRMHHFGGAPVSPGPLCNVDFRCGEICPGGIIGGINRVTCEMESAGAQQACLASEPFPSTYNCDIQMPAFGIMIPGLFPGFSILTPFGSVDILVQGGGRVDYRVKVMTPSLGPVQAFADAQGSYQPSTGALQWDVGGGVQYALYSQGAAAEAINAYDLGPSGVVRYGTDQDRFETRIDAARGVVVTN